MAVNGIVSTPYLIGDDGDFAAQRARRARRMARRQQRLRRGDASRHTKEIMEALARDAARLASKTGSSTADEEMGGRIHVHVPAAAVTDDQQSHAEQSKSTPTIMAPRRRRLRHGDASTHAEEILQALALHAAKEPATTASLSSITDGEEKGGRMHPHVPASAVTDDQQSHAEQSTSTSTNMAANRRRLRHGDASTHAEEILQALVLHAAKEPAATTYLSVSADGEETGGRMHARVPAATAADDDHQRYTEQSSPRKSTRMTSRARRFGRGDASRHTAEIMEALGIHAARQSLTTLSTSTVDKEGICGSLQFHTPLDAVDADWVRTEEMVEAIQEMPSATCEVSESISIETSTDLRRSHQARQQRASTPEHAAQIPLSGETVLKRVDEAVIELLEHKVRCPSIGLKDLKTFDMGWSVQSLCGLFEIGSGSYGRVLIARHAQTNTALAIKQPFRSDNLASPGEMVDEIKATRTRSIKEAMVHELVSDCPFFPTFLGTLETGNDICLAVEFIGDEQTAGGLSLLNPPVLSTRKALGIAEDIVRGILVLHDHGILHNDLKTDNVMLKRQGGRRRPHHLQAVIIDFGLASTVDRPLRLPRLPEDVCQAYLQGQEVDYLAPELVLEGKPTSTASDVFSLGRIFLDIEQRVTDPTDHAISKLCDLGVQCMARDASGRPELRSILKTIIQIRADRKPLWRRMLAKLF